ncbi:hypothetical protein N7468_008281 [Penicillium chermesinum]|uniref:PQ loop repeat protein n=1 Tax=Penicillium chermesinum TaxID=63820 RepID=A0A9W9NPG5_9EURO|nr:uncharacterized protein N7468_008281 [Penicillium chermesinum]KAJ5223739.1 hypothetical protein N7468_008281 [Penicillium chermesinum]
MSILQTALEYGAPFFLISSPLTSYADQIVSIHRSRSSAGFSLDIPLIMLLASILKVFFWFGEYYSKALLAQAVVMIATQLALLKVALDNRPSSGLRNGIEHTPFSGVTSGSSTRPYEFWQWTNTKPYWMFLTYFVAALTVLHLTPISESEGYINLLGSTGLAIEATLPIPQILVNHRSGSCKGLRLSVLAAWLIGDTMKMSYFFCSEEAIPWAFKICGIFQCVCDFYLGFQYLMFTRNAKKAAGSSHDHELEEDGGTPVKRTFA